MKTKIQVLNGNEVKYITITEFVSIISDELYKPSKTQNPPVEDSNQILSIIELCDLLGITKPTVNSWVKKGLLFPVKLSSRVYFMKSDIDELLRSKKGKQS